MAFSYSLSLPVNLTELFFKLILPLMIPVLFYRIKRRTKDIFLRELQELKAKFTETKDRVDLEEINTIKMRRPEVKLCLEAVDGFLQGEVKKFQESTFYRVPLLCDFRCWMADLVDQIRELNSRISSLASPLVGTTPLRLPFDDPKRSIDGGQETLDDIRRHLKNDQVGIIGVHGMRGIGKTTYLKVIAHELWKEFGVPEDHEGQGGVPEDHEGQGGVPEDHEGQGGVPEDHKTTYLRDIAHKLWTYLRVIAHKLWRKFGVPEDHEGQGGVPEDHKTTYLRDIAHKLWTYIRVIAHKLWRKFGVPEDHEGQGSGPVLIWATTNLEGNPILNLQKSIGDWLGLSLPTTPDALEGSAAAIQMKLESMQFTLLLDGVPESLKWDVVGIPLPRPGGNCKIVFTAHSQETCRALQAHKLVEVKALKEDESWSLFKKTVGEVNLRDTSIEKVARCMSTKCGCLPDALVTVARAMRRCETLPEWQEASAWWNAPVTSTPPLMEEVTAEMKSIFDKMSDYLTPSTSRGRCLLYCSLFPEGGTISVPRLVDYWIGEGFLEVWEWNRVRKRAYTAIWKLLCDCFLVRGSHKGEVLLHDVVRRTAIWLTRRERNGSHFYLTSVTLRLLGGGEFIDWADAERISYIGSEEQVPSGDVMIMRECPKLLTLLLNHEGDMLQERLRKVVPENFFRCISKLCVLDLSGVNIDSFLPGIASLVLLNYLNLSDTNITKLPEGLKELKKLRQLHLRGTAFLLRFPHWSINKYGLQALDLYGSHVDMSNLLGDLEEFKNLSELGLSLTSISHLERLLSSDKLSTCTAFLQLENMEGLLQHHLSQVFQIMENLRQLSVQNRLRIEFSINEGQLPKLEILSLAKVVINPQEIGERLLESLQQLHTDYEDLQEISWVRQLSSCVMISTTGPGAEELAGPMKLGNFIGRAFPNP